MRKILLTSNGFENPRLAEKFIELVGKRPEDMRCLFIPTAAIDVAAIEVLPKCLHDLLDLGVPAAQILVYDLHETMNERQLCAFDAVYVAGGDTRYLLRRMKEAGFDTALKSFYETDGVYVGVSAGSVAAAANYPDGLRFIPCALHVHCEKGTAPGVADLAQCNEICLSAAQAVCIEGETCMIME